MSDKCQACGRSRPDRYQGWIEVHWKTFRTMQSDLCFDCENKLDIIIQNFIGDPKKTWFIHTAQSASNFIEDLIVINRMIEQIVNNPVPKEKHQNEYVIHDKIDKIIRKYGDAKQ